jgi:hypothetical protein
VKIVGGDDDGKIYRFMGDTGSIKPSTAAYDDLDLWQEVLTTDAIPSIGNISQSDAIAVGGVVVRNDVRGGAKARVSDAQVASATLTIEAIASSAIQAKLDSYVESSGGSAFGTGTSLAVNATIATNLVLGGASADLLRSVVDTLSGDALVRANNASEIEASNKSVTKSGDSGAGVMLAFNTLGWKAQNILTQSVDALVGTSIGTVETRSAVARVVDSTVTASGSVKVEAIQAAQLSADLSNDSTSAASALFNASSLAVSAVLAMNRVASEALATVDGSTLSAQGRIDVLATEKAGIEANSDMKAISSTTNDFGASLVGGLIGDLTAGYQYTSRPGT